MSVQIETGVTFKLRLSPSGSGTARRLHVC